MGLRENGTFMGSFADLQLFFTKTVTLQVPSVSKEEGWPQETLLLPFTTLASVISMPYKYLNLVCPPAWEHTPLVRWKSSKPCFNDCERNDVNWLPAVPAHSQKCKFSHL